MKRLLFEIHRWAGIALALFMLLWFFSGLLIVFAEPTTPDRARQLANAETLQPAAGWLSAGEAWERSAPQRKALSDAGKKPAGENRMHGGAKNDADAKKSRADDLVEARLVAQAGEPVWLIEDGRGRHFALSALDGRVHETTPDQALRIAQEWLGNEAGGVSARYVETVEKPAILRNQEALSPFHRIAADDGRELLVSARSGEVVSASTRAQRALYWAGNWVHLFRPLDLAGLGEWRVTALTWTAFVAVAAALTGLIVGWLRWRPGWFGKKTYSEGRTQPYRNAWYRWHFWAGLIGGVFALVWGLSGFLNNNPWQLFSPANPGRDELARYAGAADAGLARSWCAEPSAAGDVVERTWRRLGDDTVSLAYTRDGRRLPQADSVLDARFGDAAVLAAVRRIAGDVPVASQTLLQDYDSYYYLRHHRDAADRPLPVVRVDLADAVGTSYYIDPQDGRLLLKLDHSRRVFRWLYSALHHWDFGWLYAHPVWDAWMVVWVLFGLTLSATAVVVGWKRLVLTFRRRRHHREENRTVGLAHDPATLTAGNQPG